METRDSGGRHVSVWRGRPCPIGPVVLVTSAHEGALRDLAGKWCSGEVRWLIGESPSDGALKGLTEDLRLPPDQRHHPLLEDIDREGGVFMAINQGSLVDIAEPRYEEALVREVQQVELQDAQEMTDLVARYGSLGSIARLPNSR